jgi:hypothetical protein
MSANAEPNPQSDPDALEAATDQVIAACDGDVRAAVQALIVANGLLEAELNDQALRHQRAMRVAG